MFTQEHEAALEAYVRDIAAAKSSSSQATQSVIRMENELNDLWGQIACVVYVIRNGMEVRHILCGEAKEEQTEIGTADVLTILKQDGTHIEQTGGGFPMTAEYAVKWIQRASGMIGGKEVAIEAKQESIAMLQKQYDKETDAEKRQAISAQISALRDGVQAIYLGDSEAEGLYSLMRRAVLLVLDRDTMMGSYSESMINQAEIEQRFAEAMGDMLRDGYWSNDSYAPGQEELLYLEACEVMDTLSRPAVTYNVTIQNLSGVSGYEHERFTLNAA